MNLRDHMLSALQEQLARWEELLAGLDAAQISAPLLPSAWTVKDVIAHLWAWQQRSLARLEAGRDGREPVFPHWEIEASADALDSTQQVNDWIYQAYRHLPWTQVHQDWQAGYQRLLAISAGFPERELLDSDRYPWMQGYSLADVLLGTYDHHLEHYEPLVAWLQEHGAQQKEA